MFLRAKSRMKDGKTHRYWSVVENRRVSGGGRALKYGIPEWLKIPPLVRLKVHNARRVKVPFRENAFCPVTDRNCDTVRCGGEQREVKS
ncbi:hypothetical protein [Candidatus Brocadia sinica]|uniref:Uncharacterized protein n=1 Tax=Candidatus Brocadia sinica JPN1 TaxID=1197129 RepID=A0ABQ0JZ41_9BACT|nr:hypothetical protein [Candidatus Brocadia sinica]MBL1168461.1 hypothetical protein [Candidatus Brocadia sp. AMX1]NOG40256.1 hypothetical protein [Planctomycetota bacterium]GAN33913.1 hypothetical protein BROSI_A2448 [Candidatus Brocadia sinica JPN1]